VVAEKEEPLTGEVQGRQARQGEERLARAFDKDDRVREYKFRPVYVAGRGLPGSIEVDFSVDYGPILLVFVDDLEFVHKSASARARDKFNVIVLMSRLGGTRVQVPQRVAAGDLETQDAADAVANRLLGG
jgi:hypothetical protein